MRLLLKILAMPIILVLTLIEWMGHYIIGFSSFIFYFLSGVVFIIAMMGILFQSSSLITGTGILGILVFGFILFLLPYIGQWLLNRITNINDCIKDFTGI